MKNKELKTQHWNVLDKLGDLLNITIDHINTEEDGHYVDDDYIMSTVDIGNSEIIVDTSEKTGKTTIEMTDEKIREKIKKSDLCRYLD